MCLIMVSESQHRHSSNHHTAHLIHTYCVCVCVCVYHGETSSAIPGLASYLRLDLLVVHSCGPQAKGLASFLRVSCLHHPSLPIGTPSCRHYYHTRLLCGLWGFKLTFSRQRFSLSHLPGTLVSIYQLPSQSWLPLENCAFCWLRLPASSFSLSLSLAIPEFSPCLRPTSQHIHSGKAWLSVFLSNILGKGEGLLPPLLQSWT